jgi:hypothetical protein
MLPLLALFVGIYLGLYFNVLMLVPSCVLGAAAYVMASAAAGHNLSDSVLELALLFVTVQMGYFLGLTARAPLAILLARFNLGPSRQA